MCPVAIIPARGGSKRIPKKNIRAFHGVPILTYSIRAARDSGCFERIIVSTDCEEIAKVAMASGAEVPFLRSAELADDYTGTNAVVADALKRLDISDGDVSCIYATAPFLSSRLISAGYEILKSGPPEIEYAVSVTTFSFPIQRCCRIAKQGGLQLREPSHRLTRSQDLEEFYHDAGQLYWGTANAFLEDKPLFSGNTLPIILPRYLVQDIDTEEDWISAETMYQVLRERGEV